MRTQYDIHHSGTIGSADRTAMTFDEHSITHLMNLLTDLYSNPTLAVVREYSTNAWDAHIAAGNLAPIQVTLPTFMMNQLTIKDLGTGMSVTDITDKFSKYGYSSKRDNDDETGMLGLGCKSGLTYTSQFTLVTIQNGIKATVLVTREEAGGGVVQIIDTSATTDPNGTEVQIPCKDYDDMGRVAEDFFQYWEPGTVLVNGVEPDCIWNTTTGISIDPDILMLPTDGGRNKVPSMIVMGGVAYPVNEFKLPSNLQGNIDRMRAIIRVPIGSVNFTPNREALTYTKRTLETIGDAWAYIYRGMQTMVQAKVDVAANPKEAWRIWKSWRYVLGKNKVTFNGDPFVDRLEIPDKNRTLMMQVHKASWSDSDRSERLGETIDLERAYGAKLHVVGHQGTAIAASTKARIRAYAYSRGIHDGSVLVYPKLFGAPWLSNATVNRVRFDVIQAIKLPEDENKVKTTRQRAKYRTLVGQDSLSYTDALPTEVECWLPAAYNKLSRKEVREFSGEGVVAVVLVADEKRFVRDHPQIHEWEAWADARVMSIPFSGTDWDNFHYHFNKDSYGKKPIPAVIRNGIDPDKVIDPDLRSLIRAFRDSSNIASKFSDRIYGVKSYQRKLGVTVPAVPQSNLGKVIDDMAAYYEGLLEIESHNSRKALVKAINAFYIVKNSLHVIPVL